MVNGASTILYWANRFGIGTGGSCGALVLSRSLTFFRLAMAIGSRLVVFGKSCTRTLLFGVLVSLALFQIS